MHVVPPPKSSDSITGGSAELQTYQTWKGSNVFLLQGRLIFGPDVRSIFLTIFLIVTPVAIFCGFIGQKLMDEYSDSFGISIIVVAVVFTIYRNYRFFFMFVSAATLLCIYVFGLCWVFILRVKDRETTSIWKAMTNYPASVVLLIYTFIAVWFVGGLTVFHLYLISTNQSTYENFRYRYDRRVNPYNKGVIKNFKEIFFTSIPASKNKFRGKVQKEPGIPPHVVGGSFVSPNLGKAVGDIEAGRKPVWDDSATGLSEVEEDHSNDDGVNRGGEFAENSPDLSRIIDMEGTEGRSILHPRRSSWGRRSGTLDIPPDVVAMASGVGDSNQIIGDNNGSLTTRN